MTLELIPTAHQLRKELLSMEAHVRILPRVNDIPEDERKPEVLANIMLALRHLEDARMRLGKVIQHAEGRPSIFDTPPALASVASQRTPHHAPRTHNPC
jgi:hypothetical protein